MDFEKTKQIIESYGISDEQIISLKEYEKHLGVGKLIFSRLAFVPSMVDRVNQYIKRNGIKGTTEKIRERMGK